MTTTEYAVTGMSCGHCERAIREEVEAITGVIDVHVSAAQGSLSVTSTSSLDERILAAVDEAGYTATRK